MRCNLLHLLLRLDFFRLLHIRCTTVTSAVKVLLQLLLVKQQLLRFHIVFSSLWSRVEVEVLAVTAVMDRTLSTDGCHCSHRSFDRLGR